MQIHFIHAVKEKNYVQRTWAQSEQLPLINGQQNQAIGLSENVGDDM